MSEFASFLQRWISFIESYNCLAFIIYYIATLRCVLENFNCTQFDGRTLILGKGTNTETGGRFTEIGRTHTSYLLVN